MQTHQNGLRIYSIGMLFTAYTIQRIACNHLLNINDERWVLTVFCSFIFRWFSPFLLFLSNSYLLVVVAFDSTKLTAYAWMCLYMRNTFVWTRTEFVVFGMNGTYHKRDFWAYVTNRYTVGLLILIMPACSIHSRCIQCHTAFNLNMLKRSGGF